MHFCAVTLLVVFGVVVVVQCQQSKPVAANSDSTDLSALVAVCQQYPYLEVCADVVNELRADDSDENVEKRKGSFIRLGKRKGSFIRLGKRKGSFIRLGRSANPSSNIAAH